VSALAQGSYRYWRDGALQDITEPWQLHRQGDGYVLRGQRCVAGRPLLDIEASYHGTACKRLRLHWQPRAADGGRTLHYRHHEQALHWQQDGSAAEQTFPVPEGSLLFPLLRAAAGPLLRHLTKVPATVVLPCLHDPADGERFLKPLLSARRAVLLDTAADSGEHYRYYGGEYGERGSDYWVAADDRLLRYRWESPQGLWEVRLEDAVTAPDFTGFR